MALCRPSASSHSVFQNTPGRRSTHGTRLVCTKWLTGGGVVTGGSPLGRSRGSARGGEARLAEGVADRVAELLDGQRALDLAAVDEEGGRGADTRLAAFSLVGHDGLSRRGGVEALGEAGGVQAEPPPVGGELVSREGGLGQEEQVVVFPESALGARAPRGHRGRPRQVVGAQRE